MQGKKKISDEYQEDEIFQAPVIVREPSSRQCKLGSNVVLRITATGKPLPSYQWFHNGKKISGANTDRLTLSKVRRASAGAYHCEAKNFVGKAASRQCMVSFYLNKIPKLVVEPKDAKVQEGKPIHLKVVTNNPAEFKEFKVFWVFNGLRIKGAHGLELNIASGKKKYEGEYKAMISVGSGIETSNVVKVKIVPAKAAAPAEPMAAPEPEYEGTMVGKLPELSVSPPAEEEVAAPAAPDWEEFLFDPEAEGISAPDPISDAPAPHVARPEDDSREDSTRDFDSRSVNVSPEEELAAAVASTLSGPEEPTQEFNSRGLRMTAEDADELLGIEKLNPIQAIERLKAEHTARIEREKSIQIQSPDPEPEPEPEEAPSALKPCALEEWESFAPEEDEDPSHLIVAESETQKSMRLRELMQSGDAGEEEQLAEALLAVREHAEPADSGLVEVVGTDGFTGAIDLVKAMEARDAGEHADEQLPPFGSSEAAFDPDPLPEPVANVASISDAASRRQRGSPRLARKRELLENMLARWQARNSRKDRSAA